MTPVPQLAIPKEALAEFCRRNRVRRLSLFGSVLREDFSPASDVDALAEFEQGATVTFFTLSRVEAGLSSLVGRRVDLHVARSLSPYLRDRVLSQAIDVYVAA